MVDMRKLKYNASCCICGMIIHNYIMAYCIDCHKSFCNYCLPDFMSQLNSRCKPCNIPYEMFEKINA